jgi:hypothetical protein
MKGASKPPKGDKQKEAAWVNPDTYTETYVKDPENNQIPIIQLDRANRYTGKGKYIGNYMDVCKNFCFSR